MSVQERCLSRTFGRNPLLSARVTSPEGIERIRNICLIWQRRAVEKLDKAFVPDLSIVEKKKYLAMASAGIIENLCVGLFDILNRQSQAVVYIAFDTMKKVHSVALATLRPRESSIQYLGTNPDDLDILGTEDTMVRGGGTALIRHIVRDVLLRHTEENPVLSLLSAAPAVSFYEKLGFEAGILPTSMSLSFQRMESLLRVPAKYPQIFQDDITSVASLF
jgi:hypothetical protein